MRTVKAFYEALRRHDDELATFYFEKWQKTAFRTYTVQHFCEEIGRLRKVYKETKRQQALLFAEIIGQQMVAAFPQHVYATQQYGWVLYDLYVKNTQQPLQKRIDKAQEILQLTTAATYSPFEVTIWKLLQLYETSGAPTETCMALVDKLDRHTLSRDELRIERQGELKIYPSSREKYYRTKIRYLFKDKHYRECYKVCYQFLYESHITVRDSYTVHETMLQCLCEIGRYEDALQFATSLAHHQEQRYILLLQKVGGYILANVVGPQTEALKHMPLIGMSTLQQHEHEMNVQIGVVHKQIYGQWQKWQ